MIVIAIQHVGIVYLENPVIKLPDIVFGDVNSTVIHRFVKVVIRVIKKLRFYRWPPIMF